MAEKILIKKLDGSMEPFDANKLRISLEKSGAGEKSIKSIILHTENELEEGMTTSEIYKNAFRLLKKGEDRPVAARYSLKRAVMELGPTGFPFERFIGEILKAKGYKIILGRVMSGACASHEIDVFAYKGQEIVLIEAKFHNQLSVKSDLKVALYVRARYDDLEKNNFAGHLKEGIKHHCWIITNTDFTRNAVNYGKCVDMKMVGWSHPHNESLQDLIEETALHPITCLTSLSNTEKLDILKTGNVLCRDVKKDNSILEKAGLKGSKLASVLDEIAKVCVPREQISEK